jgi:hypothetical protein
VPGGDWLWGLFWDETPCDCCKNCIEDFGHAIYRAIGEWAQNLILDVLNGFGLPLKSIGPAPPQA